MNAVLLAAGLGTRLRPLTDVLPKCLVPINGTALLDLWIDLLLEAGINRILINTHYLADQLRAHVSAHPARARIALFHEPRLLGTAGTLERMADGLDDEMASGTGEELGQESHEGARAGSRKESRNGSDDRSGGRSAEQWLNDPFLCIHADNLARFDLRAFLRAHADRPPGVEITMLTFETDNPSSCGIVEQDADHRVIAFHEKVHQPPGRRANGAIYVMEPGVLDFIRALPGPMKDLSTDVLPAYLGRMQAWYREDTFLMDIGTPETLARARQLWETAEACS